MLGTAGQRLSVAARQVLDKIRSGSKALRLTGLKELTHLVEADANSVFEAMAERARREEDLGADTASLMPMIHMAEERPGLLTQLIVAVKTLPEKALPPWAPVNIQNACKGNLEAEKAFREILTTWSTSSVNLPLASAAKTVLAPSGSVH
jgi:hypothetical protein